MPAGGTWEGKRVGLCACARRSPAFVLRCLSPRRRPGAAGHTAVNGTRLSTAQSCQQCVMTTGQGAPFWTGRALIGAQEPTFRASLQQAQTAVRQRSRTVRAAWPWRPCGPCLAGAWMVADHAWRHPMAWADNEAGSMESARVWIRNRSRSKREIYRIPDYGIIEQSSIYLCRDACRRGS